CHSFFTERQAIIRKSWGFFYAWRAIVNLDLNAVRGLHETADARLVEPVEARFRVGKFLARLVQRSVRASMTVGATTPTIRMPARSSTAAGRPKFNVHLRPSRAGTKSAGSSALQYRCPSRHWAGTYGNGSGR